MRRFLTVLLLTCVLPAFAQTIRVESQRDFDRLRSSIDSVGNGEVRVRFAPGTYYYREKHLDFLNVQRPGLDLSLEGNGAVLIPAGTDFVLNEGNGRTVPYDGEFSTDDGFVSLTRMEPVALRDSVKRALTHPLPVNLWKKMFCIRCREADLTEAEAADTYLILTQWYVGAVYKVHRIRNGWLYFYADRKYGTKLHEELRYGRCLPRYVLYNQRSEEHPYLLAGRLHAPDDDVLHRCEHSNFVRMAGTRIKAFRMDGFRFVGNRASEYLLRFDHVKADSLIVSGCRFEGIRSDVVRVYETDRFRFRNNVLEHCYLQGFYSNYGARDIEVRNNRFIDHGLMLSTAPAVYCQSRGFVVADNYFEDFSYSAIGLGTHFTETDEPMTAGIVENNEIWQTERFRRKPMRVLVDSGAIYVWTQNKDLVIRHNYIHDISGPHGNRGILCDDGAMNVTVRDNLILNIDHNSYCIDLRRRYSVERRKNSRVSRVNVGNRMEGNWVDGRVRFHVRKGDSTAFRGENVDLGKDYDREEVYRRWKEGGKER